MLKGKKSIASKWLPLFAPHDNTRPHIARCVLHIFAAEQCRDFTTPPCSLDLTHAISGWFPQLKKPLRGKRFASNKACVKSAEVVLKQLSQNGLLHVFKSGQNFGINALRHELFEKTHINEDD
ncbi:histone-lysine N-methyltransferase SETMAR [Trichonephila clavipes]|nr:histone-lysine N-methyltransferase SETMAR [Trichonephila clavipes]